RSGKAAEARLTIPDSEQRRRRFGDVLRMIEDGVENVSADETADQNVKDERRERFGVELEALSLPSDDLCSDVDADGDQSAKWFDRELPDRNGTYLAGPEDVERRRVQIWNHGVEHHDAAEL